MYFAPLHKTPAPNFANHNESVANTPGEGLTQRILFDTSGNLSVKNLHNKAWEHNWVKIMKR